MESKNIKVLLIAIVITLAGSGIALGQDSVALSVAPSALRALETGGIAEGQKLKIEGIVINQNDQSFTVRDAKGRETVVVVTKKTVIKKKRKGWFYGPRTSSADDIRCGLSLKVEGRGNSDGQLVAKNITIEEPDPKTTKASESRIRFFEEPANSTGPSRDATGRSARKRSAILENSNKSALWQMQPCVRRRLLIQRLFGPGRMQLTRMIPRN